MPGPPGRFRGRRLEVSCPRCHTLNAPTHDHCFKCGRALTEGAESLVQEGVKEFWAAVETDPELAREVARTLRGQRD